MAEVALVLHPSRREVITQAHATVDWLQAGGHRIRLSETDAELSGLESFAVPADQLGEGADLAVSLGGDGTMLRAVRLVSSRGVPVLGVNHGQLGYLTQIVPNDIHPSLERFFDGNFEIEERMRLEVQIESSALPELDRIHALNEAVLEKIYGGRTARLDVSLNGRRFLSYEADGLIIATPTGSTAYAFSVRGPIIASTLRALLVTPVSPHMLFDRSLVLSPDDEVRLVVGSERTAHLAVDGRLVGELIEGDAVVCRSSPHPARLVTFASSDYLQVLRTKFGLADR